MLKISILRQSFPCSCSLSSCVLFPPPFFTVKFLLKKCFLFPSPLILPSAYTNQIAITPPPMRPVLSRSTVVGGDHMFLFAVRVPVCTRSWQIINNFPLTLKKKKKLVHWTTNYTGNKSSNQWPPCLKLHWLLLRSFSTCLKCFLMTSKCWHVARFQLTSSAPLCSLLLLSPIPSSSGIPKGTQHPIPPHPLTQLSLSPSTHLLKTGPSLCVLVFYSVFHAVNQNQNKDLSGHSSLHSHCLHEYHHMPEFFINICCSSGWGITQLSSEFWIFSIPSCSCFLSFV